MEFINTVLALALLGFAGFILYWVVRFCWAFLKALWQLPSDSSRRSRSDLDGMDEGDFHNGPGGYHPGGGGPRG